MILIIKGLIIGLGKIIPGVSGSILAIRLNVYEDMICSINNIYNRKSIIFLTKIGIGIILAIIFGSNLITYLLNNFYLITMILFTLLIITGIPSVIKESNNYLISLISCIIYIMLLNIPNINILNNYFFIGFLESFTTIIPGISGTALFMSFGLYDELLYLFSNMYSINIKILLPFSIGLIIGTIIIVKFIDYCLNNYKSKTYSVILGLLIGSIITMIQSII